MSKKKARSKPRAESRVKAAKPADSSKGVASLVLGILSIIFSMVPLLGLILAILGIVFAAKQKKIGPSRAATAGLITSIIGLVLSLLWVCALIMLFAYLIPAAVYYESNIDISCAFFIFYIILIFSIHLQFFLN
jgi:hypothetical protein